MNFQRKNHQNFAQFTILGSDDITETIFSSFMKCEAMAKALYPMTGRNQNGNDFFVLTPDKFEEQFSPCLSDYSQLSESQKRGYDEVYTYNSGLSGHMLVSRISDRRISLGLSFNIEVEKPKNSRFHSLLSSAVELLNPILIKYGISSEEIRRNYKNCEAGYIDIKDYGQVQVGINWHTYFSRKLIETIGKDKFKAATENGYLITKFRNGLLVDLSTPGDEGEILYDDDFFKKTKNLMEILGLQDLSVAPHGPL